MLYTEFQGEKLSMPGFGAMRLPTLENGSIDEKQVDEMVKCALEGGVNYFDTAYPYWRHVRDRARPGAPRLSARVVRPREQVSRPPDQRKLRSRGNF